MPPPMAVRLAADLRPSTDGSAVRTSLVAGGGQAYILGWDRQTDGSRYRLLPHTAGGIIMLFCPLLAVSVCVTVRCPSVCPPVCPVDRQQQPERSGSKAQQSGSVNAVIR